MTFVDKHQLALHFQQFFYTENSHLHENQLVHSTVICCLVFLNCTNDNRTFVADTHFVFVDKQHFDVVDVITRFSKNMANKFYWHRCGSSRCQNDR